MLSLLNAKKKEKKKKKGKKQIKNQDLCITYINL